MTKPKPKRSPWKPLPATIYVAYHPPDTDGDNFWLEADRDSDGFEDGVRVGVYALKEVRTKKINHELQ